MSIEQGLFAESVFITECIKRNIEIAQPIVDKWGYDFIIHYHGYIKVQVKSCSAADIRYPNKPTYKINVRKGKHSRDSYNEGDFDLLACYIIPLDIWYLIPFKDITATTIRINPSGVKDRYNLYKDNFSLIS